MRNSYAISMSTEKCGDAAVRGRCLTSSLRFVFCSHPTALAEERKRDEREPLSKITLYWFWFLPRLVYASRVCVWTVKWAKGIQMAIGIFLSIEFSSFLLFSFVCIKTIKLKCAFPFSIWALSIEHQLNWKNNWREEKKRFLLLKERPYWPHRHIEWYIQFCVFDPSDIKRMLFRFVVFSFLRKIVVDWISSG